MEGSSNVASSGHSTIIRKKVNFENYPYNIRKFYTGITVF
jgi:hypothetical protein